MDGLVFKENKWLPHGIGWQVEENMTDTHGREESLVIKALEKGLQSRKPAAGLILHSDRGGQYVSGNLRLLIKKWNCRQSMSRADEVYDNAESDDAHVSDC